MEYCKHAFLIRVSQAPASAHMEVFNWSLNISCPHLTFGIFICSCADWHKNVAVEFYCCIWTGRYCSLIFFKWRWKHLSNYTGNYLFQHRDKLIRTRSYLFLSGLEVAFLPEQVTKVSASSCEWRKCSIKTSHLYQQGLLLGSDCTQESCTSRSWLPVLKAVYKGEGKCYLCIHTAAFRER